MQEINLFSTVTPKFKITNKIRLIECFAGIGSQAKALRNLGVDFEHYKVIEFNPYAVKSYNAIHSTNFDPLDITKVHADDLEIVDTDKYTYLLTYSFPCQDLSLAGLGKGMSKGSGTRSGLLWEVERILDECKELPQVLLMENVPQVISEKNIKDFHLWRKKLEDLGYSNFTQILNAKDYGIPQNRERCFMISILGDYFYEFPKKIPLKLKLKDMLEDKVDEKFYISEKSIQGRISTKYQKYKLEENLINDKEVHPTILALYDHAPTLYAEDRGGIMMPENTKKGYVIAHEGDGVYINRPHQKRGVVQKGMIQTIKTSPDIGVVVKDE